SEWEDMFILYCRRAASEDLRLARESNRLCADLTAVIEEREHFINKLDILVDRFWERSLSRAREKNLFIKKLKGNMESAGEIKLMCLRPVIISIFPSVIDGGLKEVGGAWLIET
ncbi:hypothetical protein Tco_1526328, partial [Tanacetum coccineum]